ncbi:FAD:protein FMN transferase [Cohnella thailandensis]|uniref:FAD:protein FMN transferase n=1 Tax=Cohnella thailandensis TaxID=557557 RepID=A0A841T7I8_9BACL|nr:FAD:protein FMN transferase [Cohnella thailandensis]MBB6638228.1 FAD:protein FMN transferase [Cohnella thailandensis]MBP1977789.1 thiamine biosynthesis lipoprotein [Cohnella thailandensis]
MHTFTAMSTAFHTIGLSSVSAGKAESWFSFIERNLSRFLPESELSSLNRSEGRPFLASALLYQAVSVADRYYRETDGLFNPYLGKALIAQGYSESIEKLRLDSDRQTADDYCVDMPEEPVALDRRMMGIRLHPELSLDLGGIAKGWSAEQLAGMLRREGVGTGAIDAGGDMILWGKPVQGWEIGIADPRDGAKNAASLVLKRPAGIATSSTLKRRWGTKEGVRHHLIDPRTQRPADTDLVQATVLAPSLTEAEVYAKCLLILGSEAGIPWLEARKPGLGCVAVNGEGHLFKGGSLNEYAEIGGGSYAAAI